jgi:hypothetical protein
MTGQGMPRAKMREIEMTRAAMLDLKCQELKCQDCNARN